MKSPSQPQLSSLLDHYQNGRYSDAEKLAISMTQEFPRHPFSWKVLGAILMRTCRMPDALVANHKTVEISPQDFEAHYDLGVTLQELGRFEEAEVSFRQAIELKPDYAKAYNNRGNAFYHLGQYQQALDDYNRTIELDPNHQKAINSRLKLLNYGKQSNP